MLYFFETLSLLAIFIIVLGEIKFIKVLDYLLDSVKQSLYSMISFLAFFISSIFGMAICQMTLYGNESLKYTEISSSVLYTIYAPAFLSVQA
jgi:hypothetical protein